MDKAAKMPDEAREAMIESGSFVYVYLTGFGGESQYSGRSGLSTCGEVLLGNHNQLRKPNAHSQPHLPRVDQPYQSDYLVQNARSWVNLVCATGNILAPIRIS